MMLSSLPKYLNWTRLGVSQTLIGLVFVSLYFSPALANLFELTVVIIWLVGAIGWIANIYKLANSSFDVLTGMLVLRIVGIFLAPLGAILGYL